MTQYLFRGNDIDLINRDVCVCSLELITDDAGRGSNPLVVPVGVMEILELVSWMQDYSTESVVKMII